MISFDLQPIFFLCCGWQRPKTSESTNKWQMLNTKMNWWTKPISFLFDLSFVAIIYLRQLLSHKSLSSFKAFIKLQHRSINQQNAQPMLLNFIICLNHHLQLGGKNECWQIKKMSCWLKFDHWKKKENKTLKKIINFKIYIKMWDKILFFNIFLIQINFSTER